MPEWEGWSDDSQVVDVSRALRVVLTEAGPYGTSRSIDDVVANLALSVDPQVVFASAEAAGLLESARMAAGDTAAPGLPVPPVVVASRVSLGRRLGVQRSAQG